MSNPEDRRKHGGLTQEQFDVLKEDLKKELLDDIFAEIGRSVVSRILWALGTLFAAVLAYLGITGKISLK